LGERRAECDGACGTIFWKDERIEIGGDWEHVAEKRRGQGLTVFGNRFLERGEGRM